MRKLVLILLTVCVASAALWACTPGACAAEAAGVAAEATPSGVGIKGGAPASADGPTVSLSFEKAPLRAVVTGLAKAYNINLVGGDKLSGTVTLHLNEAPILQALEVILKNAGFVLVARENGIYEVTTEAEVVKAGGAVDVRIFTLKFVDVAVAAQLLVPNALPDASSISQNPDANQLIISGTVAQLQMVTAILKAIDQPKQQVAIEIRVVEFFTDRAKSLGGTLVVTKSGGQLGDSGEGRISIDLTQNPAAASVIDLTFASDRLDAAISALVQKDVAQVLSAPSVTTSNGRQAEIKVVNKEPVVTRTTRVVDNVTLTDETVTFVETGVTLTVTPRVLADRKIAMELNPSVKELTGTTDTDPPVPIISDRTVSVPVVVSDGQWIMFGGLMRSSERERVRGVPLLMDIPFLGWFFKTTDTVSEQSNLIFFVQATVLTDKMAKQNADEQKAEILEHRKAHGLEGDGAFPKSEAKVPVKEPEVKVPGGDLKLKALPEEPGPKVLAGEPGAGAPPKKSAAVLLKELRAAVLAKELGLDAPTKESGPEAALLSKELEAAVFSKELALEAAAKEAEAKVPAKKTEVKASTAEAKVPAKKPEVKVPAKKPEAKASAAEAKVPAEEESEGALFFKELEAVVFSTEPEVNVPVMESVPEPEPKVPPKEPEPEEPATQPEQEK